VSVRGQSITCAAVGVDLIGLQTLGQTNICKSIQFEHIRPGSVKFSQLPRLSKIKVGRVYFEVVESISLTLDNVTQSNLDAIEDGRKLREDAFFIFDDSATVLKDKIKHVVITGQPTVYSIKLVFSSVLIASIGLGALGGQKVYDNGLPLTSSQ
jgi:hypothetical protein